MKKRMHSPLEVTNAKYTKNGRKKVGKRENIMVGGGKTRGSA